MTDAPRPAVLLVDEDALLLSGLVRLLRPIRRPVLVASSAEEAGARLSGGEVGVIVCEPRDARLAAFLIEARQRQPAIVRLILTGYPDIGSVVKAVNEAHPFKLLTKPWCDEELLATVKLAFEQYGVNRKRERLIDEYTGIRANTESAHAYHLLGALAHATHPDMNAEAIHDLPVGALLVKDGALLVKDGAVALANPAARRFLQSLGLPAPPAGSAVADLPTALAALVAGALAAPRRQRTGHRLAGERQLDYLVQDIAAGTLIAFAPTFQGGGGG